MNFYGFQKTTLLDFPNEVAATIFTGGCNMRCPFCHNKDIVTQYKNIEPIKWGDIYNHLKKRKNVLGGICISGGEPLLYDEIKDIINEIHSLGLKVKIDTNGTFPEKLKSLKIEYIAMDIKTSLKKYSLLKFNKNDNFEDKIKESINYIINSKIEHEFRTTVVPYIVNKEDISEITELIKGAQIYYLAQFRPLNTLDPNYIYVKPYDNKTIEEMKNIVESKGIKCELRINYKVDN